MKAPNPDVQLLSALADPTRLSIVRQLGSQPMMCACDFTECCDVSQPTISHHLKVLREAGVIVSERRGTNIFCSLAPSFAERFAGIGSSLAGLVTIS
jgi:ArsR family transcriptional regulator, arsenate/arsenite/antimonite-responsive transcriptional repressor